MTDEQAARLRGVLRDLQGFDGGSFDAKGIAGKDRRGQNVVDPLSARPKAPSIFSTQEKQCYGQTDQICRPNFQIDLTGVIKGMGVGLGNARFVMRGTKPTILKPF